MGLFSKKQCSLCGGDIGLLGNRKLEDGNMCKHCAARLSPWLTGRKQMTVADIQAHLNYRDQNAAMLAGFCETRVFGSNRWTVHFDDNQHLFFVTDSANWRQENPDLIRFDQIVGCAVDIREYVHTHAAPPPPEPEPAPAPGRPVPGGPAHPAPGGPGRPMPGVPTHPAPGGPSHPVPGSPVHPVSGGPGHPAPGGPAHPMSGGPNVPPPPPVTTRSYDFYLNLSVNCYWFNDLSLRLNYSEIEEMDRARYDALSYEAQEMCNALLYAAQC